MLKPFSDAAEAAIKKLSEDKNPRGSSSMHTYYSAGQFQDSVGAWEDEDGWSIGTEGGWRGHLY